MGSLPLTGRCNCGSVRFEVSEQPTLASWCHCTRCQRRSGTSGSLQARVPVAALEVLSGEDVLRAWEPPDGSPKVFCAACGSSLWSASRDGEVCFVRFGVFDTDPGVRPSFRQFVADAPAWDTLPDDGLPRFPGGRPPSA
jgi:hypothetical protein